jgi:gluconokinase
VKVTDSLELGARRLIVVMGVSGCGKSTVAQALAEFLRLPVADADDFHSATNVAKMAAGLPLDDEDRRPWLEQVGNWLAEQEHGGVMACSALRRAYRDTLRRSAPSAIFVHLDGVPEVIRARLIARPGHFMPASLLASQLATLEPLDGEERGLVVDVDEPVAAAVVRVVAALGRA